MEDFLEKIDMANLRNTICNDSDYGDETDMITVNDKVSQSANSIALSYSAKSAIKSPKNKQLYKRPTFHVAQPRSGNIPKSHVNNGESEEQKDQQPTDNLQ